MFVASICGIVTVTHGNHQSYVSLAALAAGCVSMHGRAGAPERD